MSYLMNYEGYEIWYVKVNNNEFFVVNYDGDDIVFDTEEEVKLFIDVAG